MSDLSEIDRIDDLVIAILLISIKIFGLTPVT
jgi:hypothetical protein